MSEPFATCVIDPSHILVVNESDDDLLRRDERGNFTFASAQFRVCGRQELTPYVQEDVTLDPPASNASDIYERTNTSFNFKRHPYVNLVGSDKWIRLDSRFVKILAGTQTVA